MGNVWSYVVILYFQLGKNPLTTEGAKALVKAITSAKKMEIKELGLEVGNIFKTLRQATCQFVFFVFLKLAYQRVRV